MDEQPVKAMSMGTTLMFAAAVLAAAIGIFIIARVFLNNSLNDVTDQINVANNSSYSDYDQTVVSGSQVSSALDNFKGKNTAIAILTTATKEGNGTPLTTAPSIGGSSDIAKALQYNAHFESGVSIEFKNGSYIVDKAFKTTDGLVDFNHDYAGIKKFGNPEYIPQTARFQAYLIKDTSGTIMGMVFKQI